MSVVAPEQTAPTLLAPLPATPPRAEDRRYRLSVEQYRRMAEASILTSRDRVVLLEGLLVEKMTKNPPHILSARLISDGLRALAPAGWYVAKEDPIETPDSLPEPDCSVIRGGPRDYRDRLATLADLALVVEVADSSLRDDQTLMKRIYARTGIPFYWIVNLPDRRIEVYADPTGPAERPDYHTRRDYGPDDAVPVILDGREVGLIVVRDVLP